MQHPQQAAAAAQLVRHLQPNDKVIAVFLAQYALQPQDNAGKTCQQSQSCHCQDSTVGHLLYVQT